MDRAEVREMVFAKVAAFAGVDATAVNEMTTLESLGLDSTDAVVLALEVEQETGVETDVTIFLSSANLGDAVREVERVINSSDAGTSVRTKND